MKKWTKILLIIVIVILLLFVGMSYFIGTQVFMGSTQLVTCEDTSKVKDSFWERYNMDYDVFCSTYTIEKVEITSTFDEHMIPADYIYALGEEGDKNNPTVILVHGLGGNRYTNFPLAEMFLQKGYNVLTYDQRSSNENTAQYTTFGYWEKYDLIDFDLGVKITGAGFPVYKGKGARLQRALINFFLDEARAAGYEEIMPPTVVNAASGYGTGQLPDKEGQMYHCNLDDLYLIPTAEVPVTNIYRDVILDEKQLVCGKNSIWVFGLFAIKS